MNAIAWLWDVPGRLRTWWSYRHEVPWTAAEFAKLGVAVQRQAEKDRRKRLIRRALRNGSAS